MNQKDLMKLEDSIIDILKEHGPQNAIGLRSHIQADYETKDIMDAALNLHKTARVVMAGHFIQLPNPEDTQNEISN
jgi:GH35 family endo-1,4-beta-xylanase